MVKDQSTSDDVFAKLCRVIDTNDFTSKPTSNHFSNDIDDLEIYDLLAEGNETAKQKSNTASFPQQGGLHPDMSRTSGTQSRPTPFDVWKKKQKKDNTKATPKLNGQQWDKLVDKMHQSSRIKHSVINKDQNESLALELGGNAFKPNINATSLNLSATMKPLQVRMPEMITEREKGLVAKRKENELMETAECSFAPSRTASKTSDMYLKRQGREKPATPNDFYRYAEEKERRIEMRKQILDEIEDKELTFKPQIGEKSQKLQEKLLRNNAIEIDDVTRTVKAISTPYIAKDRAKGAPRVKLSENASGSASPDLDLRTVYEGPVMVIESEHPYRHNISEYTTVQVHGAVGYEIAFDEETRTEAVFDFVKFFDDESHTVHLGAGKYSGGHTLPHLASNGKPAFSPCNWPGVRGRPPLIINSSKFVIHFKTNGQISDWGFKMYVIPTLMPSIAMTPKTNVSAGTPIITATGKNYVHKPGSMGSPRHTNSSGPRTPVHDRLYQQGLEKKMQQHNNQVELMQHKIKGVKFNPWETQRDFVKPNYQPRTHLPKQTLAEAMEDLLLPAPQLSSHSRSMDEYDDENGQYHEGMGQWYTDENGNQVPMELSEEDIIKVANYNTHYTAIEFDESLNNLWKDLTDIHGE